MEPSAPSLPEVEPPAALSLCDMPEEVLALVASLGLTEACDVASFAAASKRCLGVAHAAPLRLAVRAPIAGSALQEQVEARATLQALCSAWPGIAELDLRGLPLEDHDVAAALRALPSLAVLQLSGCKKLTPAGCAALLGQHCTGQAGRSGDSPRGGGDPKGSAGRALRTVTLQRCFQLTATALSDVLAAAAMPGARLVCAALSHLTLGDWPEAGAALPPPGGQLRILALHNCAKVGSAMLDALVAACPRLEVLMLGGCSFVVEEPSSQAAPASGDGSEPGSDDSPCQPTGLPGPSCDPQVAQLYGAALAAMQEGAPALCGAGGGSGGCGGYASYVASLAAELAAAVLRLPHLRVLELTFALPGLVPALQHMAATQPVLLDGRSKPLQVWDLCTPASVEQALQWRRGVAARHLCSGSVAGAPNSAAGIIAPRDADAFLSAAVNCSSAGRATPLHAAAEEGNARQLSALLGLGAAVDARDRGGATPLFVACEAGRDASVECLLLAGARIEVRNAADESPLYISALKGHQRCVELLLESCQARGISWQAQRLYGHDGWTPLMAAAVGGRTAIVLKLLQAAGQEAPALVQQATRYGQNAVHLAARKASASLLRSLVDAGGTDSLLAADADGRLPSDIAKRNNNGSALRLLADAGGAAVALRREQARQRSTVPTAERPRANDHRQQHPQQRWVGRRLQQRKGSGGGAGQGGSGGSGGGGSSGH